MARTAAIRGDATPSPEEASPLLAESGHAPAIATGPVAWPGTADLLDDQPDDLATARMLVLAAFGGLAFWILLAFLLM